MKTNRLRILNYCFLGLFLTLMASCNNEPDESKNTSLSTTREKDYYLKLGKKLENPYSVKNMRMALRNLKNKSITSKTGGVDEDFEIEPTNLYVKFEPTTEVEEAVLKKDSSLVLFDYPLDYEFTEQALEARPELKDKEVPTYYTAIKIDSEIASEAQYKVLEELYIPEEDPYFGSNLSKNQKISEKKEILLDKLLDEAYKLTGNDRGNSKIKENTTAKWIFGKKWWPSGKITVYDEVAGMNKPVVGAQVLIRQWFTIRQAITDENGDFSTSSIRGSARYVLQWERYNYSIRNGSFFQAETKSHTEQKDEPWNLNITGGDDKYHAIIHQAAHDYYYGHRFGLISPPMNNQLYNFGRQGQIKIAARETAPWGVPSSYSHVRSDLSFGLSAQIHIKAWGRASDRVYGTTIHELSHALHSVLDRGSYDNIARDAFLNSSSTVQNRNRRLLETWPTTVEILMTLDRYKTKFNNPNYEYGNTDGFLYRNMQRKTINSENHYTSCGYDMLDNVNQSIVNGNGYPIDRVSGYTIKQLQDALIGAKQWNDWKVNIKNKYNNPTAQYLDELFNNWQD